MSVLIVSGLHLDHWHAADRDTFANFRASGQVAYTTCPDWLHDFIDRGLLYKDEI
jgi:hypothetical protein